MHPIRSGWLVLLMRMACKGKQKIQDCWENTIYHVKGQPYVGLPVFRITLVAGEGKVSIVHWNMLLPYWGNMEENSENEGSWQGVDRPPDSIMAVSDDGVLETEVSSADPEPEGEGDIVCVQHVQTGYKPNYFVKTVWGWVKSLNGHQ